MQRTWRVRRTSTELLDHGKPACARGCPRREGRPRRGQPSTIGGCSALLRPRRRSAAESTRHDPDTRKEHGAMLSFRSLRSIGPRLVACGALLGAFAVSAAPAVASVTTRTGHLEVTLYNPEP